MRKLYMDTKTLGIFKRDDHDKRPPYIDGELGGLYIHSCDNRKGTTKNIETIKSVLKDNGVSFEELNTHSILIRKRFRSEIDTVHQMVRSAVESHFFSILTGGYDVNLEVARASKRNILSFDEKGEIERLIVCFEKGGNVGKVVNAKRKSEKIRIVSVPASSLKKETKIPIGNICVTDDTEEFYIHDPSEFRYGTLGQRHQVFLTKGNYIVYKIADEHEQIVGLTIDCMK